MRRSAPRWRTCANTMHAPLNAFMVAPPQRLACIVLISPRPSCRGASPARRSWWRSCCKVHGAHAAALWLYGLSEVRPAWGIGNGFRSGVLLVAWAMVPVLLRSARELARSRSKCLWSGLGTVRVQHALACGHTQPCVRGNTQPCVCLHPDYKYRHPSAQSQPPS